MELWVFVCLTKSAQDQLGCVWCLILLDLFGLYGDDDGSYRNGILWKCFVLIVLYIHIGMTRKKKGNCVTCQRMNIIRHIRNENVITTIM